MYNYYTMGKIPLQASTNVSYQLTIYFPTEYEQLVPRIWIYTCLHRKLSDSDKGDCTDNVKNWN